MNDSRTRYPPAKVPSNVYIFSLSAAFFAAAALLFLAGMALGIRYLPDLAENLAVRSPIGWTMTHLLILGWVTMLAMGASYQLVQVMLRTSLYSRTLGFLHFICYTAGLIVLIVSFCYAHMSTISIGGSLITIGVIAYAVNMAATIVHKQEWSAFVFGLSLSLLHLFITVLLGVFMGISLWKGWNAQIYRSLFHTHLWLGLAGWMTGLILTISFKLLPMFYMSKKKIGRETYAILSLFQAGVLLQVFSFWCSRSLEAAVGTAAWLCLAASAALFIQFVRTVWKYGKSPRDTVSRRNHTGHRSFVRAVAMRRFSAVRFLYAAKNEHRLCGFIDVRMVFRQHIGIFA